MFLAAGLFLAACGTGSSDSNQVDYEQLATCGSAACPEGFAQRIEEGEPATINDMACIVEAMRDRKPGLYRVKLDLTVSNGSSDANIEIFVTASGEVEMGIHHTQDTDGEEQVSTWEPTQRCSLAEASFFDACLTATKAGSETDSTDDAWACIYPGPDQELPWFEDCVDATPTCE